MFNLTIQDMLRMEEQVNKTIRRMLEFEVLTDNHDKKYVAIREVSDEGKCSISKKTSRKF